MSDHDTPAGRRFGARARAEGERGARTAPRTWAALLDAWGALLGELCACLPPDEAEQGRSLLPPILVGGEGWTLHLTTWRWMWSLPPCSEARKAAHTLGHVAVLIGRWRAETDPAREDDRGPCSRRTGSGHAAEAELRMAAWHVGDARGERAAIDLHGGQSPTVPRHEAVYIAGVTESSGQRGIQVTWCSHEGINFTSAVSGKRGAHMILHHHLGRGQLPKIQVTDALLQRFGETAVASLPNGPWVMTSRDVCRFLDMLLEDAEVLWRTGQDGEPVRDVTASEYEAHCKRHEPPPLGCEHHHEPGERCDDTCAFPMPAERSTQGRGCPGGL